MVGSNEKLEAMTEGGRILATILNELKTRTVPGTKTKEIDEWANRLCLKYKVKPSFLNYEGYPASICVSINDEVVHGIPSEKIIDEGDIVSLDFGVYHKGYHTDSAITFGIGTIPDVAKRLLEVTEKSLYIGIEQAKAGHRLGDIGYAVQKVIEDNGFGVVRALVGHGIGKKVHEEPLVPNFGSKHEGSLINVGQALAIEPMVTGGSYDVVQDEDGWTYKTEDGSFSAHFEHTIYISKDGPIILTKFEQ